MIELPIVRKELISDKYGRSFKSLRVSLTNKCNMACTYCVESAGEAHEKTTQLSSAESLKQQIASLHDILDLKEIRFTGGEPLLNRNLVEIVEYSHNLGIEKLKITTNGLLLARQVDKLANAGITSVNVSLDAIYPEVFHAIGRTGKLDNVLEGIESALDAGLEVKINTVVQKNMNENQVLPLFKFASQRDIVIRYLEVMKMGHVQKYFDQYFVPEKQIVDKIASHYQVYPIQRDENSTAHYFVTDTGKKFGVIANVSKPFCNDCDRLRLDSKGKIYGCLSNNNGIKLNENSDNEETIRSLKTALSQKQDFIFKGSDLSMKHIGG